MPLLAKAFRGTPEKKSKMCLLKSRLPGSWLEHWLSQQSLPDQQCPKLSTMQYSSGSSFSLPQFENFQQVDVALIVDSTALPLQPLSRPNSLNHVWIVFPQPSNFPQSPSIGLIGSPSRPHVGSDGYVDGGCVDPTNEKPAKTSGIVHVKLKVMEPPLENPAAKRRAGSTQRFSSIQSTTARVKSTSLTAPPVLHCEKPAFHPSRGVPVPIMKLRWRGRRGLVGWCRVRAARVCCAWVRG